VPSKNPAIVRQGSRGSLPRLHLYPVHHDAVSVAPAAWRCWPRSAAPVRERRTGDRLVCPMPLLSNGGERGSKVRQNEMVALCLLCRHRSLSYFSGYARRYTVLTVPLGAFAAWWTSLCTRALWSEVSFRISTWRLHQTPSYDLAEMREVKRWEWLSYPKLDGWINAATVAGVLVFPALLWLPLIFWVLGGSFAFSR
jgi:hypothetical protein